MIRRGDPVRICKDGHEYPARVTIASENQKSLLVQLDHNPGLPTMLPLAPDPATGKYAVTLMLSHEDAQNYRDILTGEIFEVRDE